MMRPARYTVFLTLSLILLLPSLLFASPLPEEERIFLSMFFTEEELQVVSATRGPQPVTHVAENVEVVTAKDIELMNAHTLADVLNTINGVQVSFSGGSPGSVAVVQIEGSRIEHVVILVDGVNMNDISGGAADASLIPVQMINRVEVIKGPASSVWGSSLGGIVNVITKAPGPDNGLHGIIAGSYGERNTGDFRAEVSGREDKLGFYLFSGRLQTDGLRTHDDSSRNSIYAKLSYDFSKDTAAAVSLLYNKAENSQGDFEAEGMRFSSQDEVMLSTLAIKSRLSDALSIDVSARVSHKLSGGSFEDLIAGTVAESGLHDFKYGASAKVEFRKDIHSFVFGGDYDFYRTRADFLGNDPFDQHRAALYLNDTIAWGKAAIIPGIRFDSVGVNNTSLKENALSPSLGITYEIADKTLVRGVVARGFNIPAVADLFADGIFFVKNPDLKLEKVWSYQIGVETGALNYLWLKASVFRHDVRDAITVEDVSVSEGTWTFVNKDRERRQGFEVAIRSLPVYHFTLSAAAAYIHNKDRETGETAADNPQYTYDIGLQYEDKKSFRALLKGRYIWWNASEGMNAEYNAFIFDFSAIKTLCNGRSHGAEVFLTVHNLFNGSQYWLENYKNARRWIEGGVRYRF